MQFHLVKGESPEKGVTVAIAEHAEDLDYSKLHHCQVWTVWVFWDDDTNYKIADVKWSGGAGYVFSNPYTYERLYIRQHDHIIPVISGCIFYNSIFSRYNGPNVCKTLLVYPDND